MRTPFKMKGFSGYQNSPIKHKKKTDLKDVPHTHKLRPDSPEYDPKNPNRTLTDEEVAARSGNPDYYISYPEKEKEELPEGSRVIKSGDKEYVYTPPKNKKKKRKKVRRSKRGSTRKTKNLVTGGTNITEG
mgnify:CR=1 FL=1